MTLNVVDLSVEVRAVCQDCGWIATDDDAEPDAVLHVHHTGHRVQVVSRSVQVYEP